MNKEGINPVEYFELMSLDGAEEKFNSLWKLKEEDMAEYKLLLENFEAVNAKKVTKTKKSEGDNNTLQKGQALEELVTFLWEKSGFFKIHKNIRNTTNEIDQLIDFNFYGITFEKHLPVNRTNCKFILSECKNYNKKIDVTWVGKLYSLASTNSSRFSFLFSYHGMSGDGWNAAVGLTKKLFLQREDLEKRISIIDFNINDFNSIAVGRNFLELIESKVNALILQTNFSKFLSKHPAQVDDPS